jgi:Flp pilus assembly protein TadG
MTQKKTESRARISSNSQRGVALVEFAIVLPLLVIFMYGIITFSVAILNKHIMTNATREGARVATLYGGEVSQAKPTTENYLNGKLINFGAAAEPIVTVTTTPTATGTDVRVRAEYAYGGLLQFVLTPLSAETTMQRIVP